MDGPDVRPHCRLCAQVGQRPPQRDRGVLHQTRRVGFGRGEVAEVHHDEEHRPRLVEGLSHLKGAVVLHGLHNGRELPLSDVFRTVRGGVWGNLIPRKTMKTTNRY